MDFDFQTHCKDCQKFIFIIHIIFYIKSNVNLHNLKFYISNIYITNLLSSIEKIMRI